MSRFVAISLIFRPVLALAAFGFCMSTGAIALAETNPAPDSSCSIPPSAPTADLTVRVTDPTGALIPGAEIKVRCGSAASAGITGDDGAATLHLRGGSYSLAANAPGFAEKTLEVRLPLTAPLSIAMDLGSATDTV